MPAATASKPLIEPVLSTHALCQRAGVARGTLRLYERAGLLSEPRRSAAGYRHYPADSVARLQAIRALKEVGFTLKEITLLLAEADHGEIDPARLRELAREQVSIVDLRIARLELVRRYMVAVAEGNASMIDDPQCSFLAEFLLAGSTPPAASRPARAHAAARSGAHLSRGD